MTTVVTGASGFIGSVLVRKLLSQGRSVRAIVRSNLSGLQGLDIDIVKADIRDHDAIQKALNGAESVFHLAAEISLSGDHGGRVSAINVKGSENVARAALNTGVKHFVHCSSIHSFDLRDTNRVIDESTPRVGNKHPIYDRTKAQGESVIKRLVDDGLPAVFIHPSGVIGPGDHRPSRVGKLLLDLSTKKIPALISGGFNWVDVRDVCDGAIAAEQCGRIGESYILSGYWHSPRELALLAEEITSIRPPRLNLPMNLVRTIVPLWDFWGWMTNSEPRFNSDALAALRSAHNISHAKASKELGYTPRKINTSIRDAYIWFKQSGMLSKELKQIG